MDPFKDFSLYSTLHEDQIANKLVLVFLNSYGYIMYWKTGK